MSGVTMVSSILRAPRPSASGTLFSTLITMRCPSRRPLTVSCLILDFFSFCFFSFYLWACPKTNQPTQNRRITVDLPNLH